MAQSPPPNEHEGLRQQIQDTIRQCPEAVVCDRGLTLLVNAAQQESSTVSDDEFYGLIPAPGLKDNITAARINGTLLKTSNIELSPRDIVDFVATKIFDRRVPQASITAYIMLLKICKLDGTTAYCFTDGKDDDKKYFLSKETSGEVSKIRGVIAHAGSWDMENGGSPEPVFRAMAQGSYNTTREVLDVPRAESSDNDQTSSASIPLGAEPIPPGAAPIPGDITPIAPESAPSSPKTAPIAPATASSSPKTAPIAPDSAPRSQKTARDRLNAALSHLSEHDSDIHVVLRFTAGVDSYLGPWYESIGVWGVLLTFAAIWVLLLVLKVKLKVNVPVKPVRHLLRIVEDGLFLSDMWMRKTTPPVSEVVLSGTIALVVLACLPKFWEACKDYYNKSSFLQTLWNAAKASFSKGKATAQAQASDDNDQTASGPHSSWFCRKKRDVNSGEHMLTGT